MNVSELKCQVEQGEGRFFFTRDAMRFFGDTMRNYGVRDGGTRSTNWDANGNYIDEPRTIEVWELYRKRAVKYGLQSSAYFDKETCERVTSF